MSIKFITDKDEMARPVEFRDVKENQFFISDSGKLCQKADSRRYNTISDSKGYPWSTTIGDANESMKIRKILPEVTKIEF